MESNIRILKDQLSNLSKDAIAGTELAPERKSDEAARRRARGNQLGKPTGGAAAALQGHFPGRAERDRAAGGRAQEAWKRSRPRKPPTKTGHARGPAANPQTVRESPRSRRQHPPLPKRDRSPRSGHPGQHQGAEARQRRHQGIIRDASRPSRWARKQYADLLRDRDLVKEQFIDLSEKLSKAEIAQEMEGRKQGETLELLDPASLPTTPTEPKRPMVISIGAALRPAAGNRDRRRPRDEGYVAQESEGRAGLHADGDFGQRSAARKRFRGAPPPPAGLARMDHGLSGRGRGDVRLGGVLLRDQSLKRGGCGREIDESSS